ncbi:MAG TPA: DoxX family protein [Pyrinomonadaceae bacterium]
MANSDSFYSTWAPRVLSILRLLAGFLLMQHGLQKIFGVLLPPAPAGAPQEHGTFQLLSLVGVSGILELVGGALLLVGLFTRPVAFILSGLMAVAYFMVHAPGGFWPILNRGELAVIYSFVYLYFAVAGGGAWSLDRLLRRERPSYR